MCDRPATLGNGAYCSPACGIAERKALKKGALPGCAVTSCRRCGGPVKTIRQGGKAVRRRTTLICDNCRYRTRTKHGVTPKSLADERGTACGICGHEVDLALKKPDWMRASVDHVIPYARGGNDDRSNLQLCHLICNFKKGARTAAA